MRYNLTILTFSIHMIVLHLAVLFKSMQKLTFFILLLFVLNNAYNQPLQFIDTKDSVGFLSVSLIAMEDGGWISLSSSRDSCINAIKYDFCGKVEWQDKLSTDGKIENVHAIKDGTTIYLTAVINNGSQSGIYVLNIDDKGNTQLPGLFKIQDINIYTNARICLNGKNRLIAFNAGNDSSMLNAHFLFISEFNQLINASKVTQHIPFHDIVRLDDQYVATIGNDGVFTFDDNFNILKAVSLNVDNETIQFQGVPKTLGRFSDTSILLQVKYTNANAENGIGFINLDKSCNVLQHSDKINYEIQQIGDFYSDNEVIANTSLIHYKSANRLSSVEFNRNFQMTNQKFNTIKATEDSILAIAISKNTEGRYILNTCSNDNYQYKNFKLSKELGAACQDTIAEIKTSKIEFKAPNNISLNLEKYNSIPVQSNVNRRVFDIKIGRQCEKFDLQDGVVPFITCKGDSVPIPGFGFVKKDGEYKQIISYCNRSVTITYKVEFRDTQKIVKTIDTMFLACKGEKVLLKVDTTGRNNRIRWFNGATTDTTRVTLPGKYDVELWRGGCTFDKIIFDTHHKSCFPDIKFPNVCSPGATTNENKVFLPYSPEPEKIKEWKLMIYNRWGQKVFENAKFNDPWNLIFKGELAATDSYVFVAKGIDIYGEVKEFKGVFTILR